MKRLTGALLILGIFASTALGQSVEQVMKDRRMVLFGWISAIRSAESKYKNEHDIYADLNALRDAHLLGALVFESDKPTGTGPAANFVPKATHFEVTASSDGKHFSVEIRERLDVGTVGVFADETGGGSMQCSPPQVPFIEDGPEGPLISLAG